MINRFDTHSAVYVDNYNFVSITDTMDKFVSFQVLLSFLIFASAESVAGDPAQHGVTATIITAGPKDASNKSPMRNARPASTTSSSSSAALTFNSLGNISSSLNFANSSEATPNINEQISNSSVSNLNASSSAEGNLAAAVSSLGNTSASDVGNIVQAVASLSNDSSSIASKQNNESLEVEEISLNSTSLKKTGSKITRHLCEKNLRLRGIKSGRMFIYWANGIPRIIGYKCEEGYSLRGFHVKICIGGVWLPGFDPYCLLVKCPAPTAPYNGDVIFTSRACGALCSYTCDSGFRRLGSMTSRCTETGMWQPSPPVCVTESHYQDRWWFLG